MSPGAPSKAATAAGTIVNEAAVLYGNETGGTRAGAGEDGSPRDSGSLASAGKGHAIEREDEVANKIDVHIEDTVLGTGLLNNRARCAGALDGDAAHGEVEIADLRQGWT
jgi:hypothetical protein